jgi:phosphatidylethanolamine/phosphatidyl-N-methylethanolamine N-methyltransferase
MRLDTNRWNRLRYTFWAPVYDLAVRGLDRKRRDSLALLDARPGERLLIVGAGTGADLPHLPAGCTVLAADLTPAMLKRARPRARDRMHLAVMDGHQLAVPDGAFDGVVLHLILAVIPDPARCLREASRALRPGGRVVVFDKFVLTLRPPLALRALNVVIRVLFTEMTRRFEDILERSGADLVLVRDEPVFAGGLYRRLLLRRAGEPSEPPRREAGLTPGA